MMKTAPLRCWTGLAAAALTGAVAAQTCQIPWQTVGGGTSNEIYRFIPFAEGGVTSLMALGRFSQAGGVFTGAVARWNGLTWSAVGDVRHAGVAGAGVVFDDGTGPALYVGGALYPSLGFNSHGVARWDGVAWAPVGEGLVPDVTGASHLVVHDDGDGAALYAGGSFYFPQLGSGIHLPRNFARWTGSEWVPVGGGTQRISALGSYDDGTGPALFMTVASSSPLWPNAPIHGCWRWNGQWTDVRGGWGFVTGQGFVEWEVSGRRLLLLAGSLGTGSVSYSGLHRWTGSGWQQLVTMSVNNPRTATVGSDGWLYVGGDFAQINGAPLRIMARWNGEIWQALDGDQLHQGSVSSIHIWDDGTGPGIFAGGTLNIGPATRHVVRYDLCNLQEPCYANCDGSTAAPILNVGDFMCFINEFAAGTSLPHSQQVEHYANCDGSTTAPALNVDDFTCFITRFAAGCP
jgi:trimeric autotransporter adhesin